MSKGFERAANLAHHAKALAKIISNALAQNWVGAAVEAVKHYWPYILGAAVVLILLPFIILCSLPSILFGFGSDTPEAIKGEELKGYYQSYDTYRNEQLEEIKTEQEEEYGVTCEIEYVNESLDNDWFIAIHSIHNKNDQDPMNEDNIKEFVKKTYTYEIVDADKEDDEDTQAKETASSGPWDETESQTSDSSNDDNDLSTGKKKIIKVTTLSIFEVMQAFDFDDEKTTWATLVYEIYSGNQENMDGDANNTNISELLAEDDAPYIGGEYTSPFPNHNWPDHVTSEFGKRTDPVTGEAKAGHYGIDIALPKGTEIHAVQGGTVLYVKNSGDKSYGLHLAINHGGKIVTLYAHCNEILVSEGDTIEQGDVIAKVGSTGKSTGPHLHLSFIINGVYKNPRLYLPKQPPIWMEK